MATLSIDKNFAYFIGNNQYGISNVHYEAYYELDTDKHFKVFISVDYPVEHFYFKGGLFLIDDEHQQPQLYRDFLCSDGKLIGEKGFERNNILYEIMVQTRDLLNLKYKRKFYTANIKLQSIDVSAIENYGIF